MRKFFNDNNITGRDLLLFTLSSWLVSVCLLVLAEVLRQGIHAIEISDKSSLFNVIKLAVITTLSMILLDIFKKLFRKRMQNCCEESQQIQLLANLQNKRKITWDCLEEGHIITSVMTNTERAVGAAIAYVENFVEAIAFLPVIFLYMFWIEWRISAAIVAYILLVRALLTMCEKVYSRHMKKYIELDRRNNGLFLDYLKNMLTVRIFDKNHFMQRKVAKYEQDSLHANMKAISWRNAIADATWALVKIAEFFIIFGLGAVLISKGYTTAGTLLSLTFVTDTLMKSLNCVSQLKLERLDFEANIQQIEEILALMPEEEEKQTLEKAFEDATSVERAPLITFKNVSFSYNTTTELLKNVSFTIFPGEKVLLKGPNGQGKSTLLKLMTGLYRPDKGQIIIGKNIEAIKLDSLTQFYAYIPQNNLMFSAPIAENISLSTVFDEKEIEVSLQEVNLVKALDEDASHLSAGEKQRVNIARSFYAKNRFLLLGDEIFSSIDPRNADEIMQRLERKFGDSTMIFIAHSPMPIQFDKILEVSDGKVEEKML